MLKPLFNRVGSKKDIAEYIISLLPKNIDLYVEPFLGGGVVGLNVDARKKILNDLEKELIADYKLIKKVKGDFTQFTINSDADVERYFNKTPTNNEELLLKHVIKRNNGFGSNEASNKIYKHSNPLSKLNNISLYKNALRNATFTSNDYITIINKYDDLNTVFFMDPPYENSKGLYKKSIIDFGKMANVLKNIKGKFLLTINDSDNIRKLFKDFYIKRITIKAKGNHGIGESDRKELIITNYK